MCLAPPTRLLNRIDFSFHGLAWDHRLFSPLCIDLAFHARKVEQISRANRFLVSPKLQLPFWGEFFFWIWKVKGAKISHCGALISLPTHRHYLWMFILFSRGEGGGWGWRLWGSVTQTLIDLVTSTGLLAINQKCTSSLSFFLLLFFFAANLYSLLKMTHHFLQSSSGTQFVWRLGSSTSFGAIAMLVGLTGLLKKIRLLVCVCVCVSLHLYERQDYLAFPVANSTDHLHYSMAFVLRFFSWLPATTSISVCVCVCYLRSTQTGQSCESPLKLVGGEGGGSWTPFDATSRAVMIYVIYTSCASLCNTGPMPGAKGDNFFGRKCGLAYLCVCVCVNKWKNKNPRHYECVFFDVTVWANQHPYWPISFLLLWSLVHEFILQSRLTPFDYNSS